MKRFTLYISIFLFSSIILTSCSKDDDIIEDEGSSSGSSTFGIRHDKDLSDYEKVATNISPYTTTTHPDFSAVVSFTYSLDGSDDPSYVASGILVKENWILTAGHNFFTSSDQTSPAPVSGITVNTGNDPGDPTASYSVSKLVFHPTWEDYNDVYGYANDLCLVQLSSNITTITPASINSSTSETIGDTIWHCGFGDYSQQPGQDADAYSQKHAIQNILDRKVSGIESGPSNDIYTGGLVAFDFDDPDGEVNSLGDSYDSEDESALLGTGTSSSTSLDFEGGTVEGDSGGPLFIYIGGEWKVIGILSGGATEPVVNHKDGDYGDISIYTRVSTSYDWIDSVINPVP